jgi:hypothetical protein
MGRHGSVRRPNPVASPPDGVATRTETTGAPNTGPQVERAIAWVASQSGRLNLRYLGVDKNDFWLQMRIGVLNLRRLLALASPTTPVAGPWPDRGPTHRPQLRSPTTIPAHDPT